ncbi:PREDICTED: uncharacterized protein LOC105111355 [Populus euphratica]|uniref:Uncharacterized protein LOC105111355 n=1 Tax=Populus euphratica TaxID=75702 RepID=A0AAJ6X4E7_POPEU|nr:PREDICTED: uncharacterized protein LOC105111355 [Populus euphratica]
MGAGGGSSFPPPAASVHDVLCGPTSSSVFLAPVSSIYPVPAPEATLRQSGSFNVYSRRIGKRKPLTPANLRGMQYPSIIKRIKLPRREHEDEERLELPRREDSDQERHEKQE